MKTKKKQKVQKKTLDLSIQIANVLEKAGVPVSEAAGLALLELGACIATLSGTPAEVLVVTLAAGMDKAKHQLEDMAAQGIRLVGGRSGHPRAEGV